MKRHNVLHHLRVCYSRNRHHFGAGVLDSIVQVISEDIPLLFRSGFYIESVPDEIKSNIVGQRNRYGDKAVAYLRLISSVVIRHINLLWFVCYYNEIERLVLNQCSNLLAGSRGSVGAGDGLRQRAGAICH